MLLAVPVAGLDTGMPSIKVVPEEDGSRQGYEQVQAPKAMTKKWGSSPRRRR